MELLKRTILKEFERYLQEDDVAWDYHDLLYFDETGEFSILLKEKAFVPALFVFNWILKEYGLEVLSHVNTPGFYENCELIKLRGNATVALQIERSFLNLLSHFLGVATMTRKAVKMVEEEGVDTKIAATRKTYPGLRLFEKLAVYLAGGDTHRFSLKDMVMIKDNHIRLFKGTITELVLRVKSSTSFTRKIEIEVENLDMLKKVLDAPVDIIMLDNFSPSEIKEAVRIVRGTRKDIILEASGGITLSNLKEYLHTGVDVISMGSIIHSAPFINVSMEVAR